MAASLTASERVIELMRTLNEARIAYDSRSLGGGASLMPSMWNEGSYAELEQALIGLRDSDHRQWWWHASTRYRWGAVLTYRCSVKRSRQGPQYILPRNCELIAGLAVTGSNHAIVRIYRWGACDPELVALGIDALAHRMKRIQLPRSVLYRKLGIEERETA